MLLYKPEHLVVFQKHRRGAGHPAGHDRTLVTTFNSSGRSHIAMIRDPHL